MSEENKLSDVGVVDLYKAYEPRLDIRADRDYIAMMGAANISTQRYSANSSSSGQIIWSLTTPSVRNGVDRRVEMDCTATCEATITGGQPAPTAAAKGYFYRLGPITNLSGTKFGPRQWPLHQITETIQVRLNDQAFSWEPSQQVAPLLEYGLVPEDRQYSMGSTPHYPDQFWRYTVTDGTQRDEFSSWMNQTFEDGRNAGIWLENFDPAKPTAGGLAQPSNTFKMRMIESILLSPFAYHEDVQAFFGVQNLDVSLTFRNPLERMFCGDIYSLLQVSTEQNAGSTIDQVPADAWKKLSSADADANLNVSLKINFEQQLQNLHVTYLQPQINQTISWRLNYPYWQIQKFQNPGAIFSPLERKIDLAFNNVTLHNIPKRMYLYCMPDEIQPTAINGAVTGVPANYFGTYTKEFDGGLNDSNCGQANFYASLETLRVNFDTQDGRFSTLDSFDLYKIASSNGYKRSFKSWSQYQGSVMCVEFGKDLNLNPLLCPGTRGNFQLSATATWRDVRNQFQTQQKNPDDPTITNPNKSQLIPKAYRLYMIIVNTGIVTIQNQLITSAIGAITEIQVEEAPWLKAGFRQSMKTVTGEGSLKSNLYSGIKKAIKTVGPYVSPVADIVGDIASLSDDPRASTASKVAKVVSKVSKGRGRTTGGSVIVGGKRVSAHSLSRRM